MSICLCMIVKNERAIIRRCLESVRPHIDHWQIVDTGSTDGTQDVVRSALADLPGELHERPWRNFGHNRSEALALALPKADYLLTLDADEELVAPPSFRFRDLSADQYLARYRLADSEHSWYRSTLLTTRLPWRYEGVVHEYPTCDAEYSTQQLEGVLVQSHTDGARNRAPRDKFARDAELLEQALARDPNNARNVFYLAQSYRDAGESERALTSYARRVELGGWAEEVWYSLFQLGVMHERCGAAAGVVQAAYLRAYAFRPQRAEPLSALSALSRLRAEWPLSELFARAALPLQKPADILFVDDSVYAWRVRDELSIACYWVGKYAESARLARSLLASPLLPARERARVEQNLRFAEAKLAETQPPEPPARRSRKKARRRAGG